MITTVTLNVSVDKAYYIKGIVVPGTVARVQKCVNSAGGNMHSNWLQIKLVYALSEHRQEN